MNRDLRDVVCCALSGYAIGAALNYSAGGSFGTSGFGAAVTTGLFVGAVMGITWAIERRHK